MKSGKSQGTDGVCSEFYKTTCFEITYVLCSLFNAILDSVFPLICGGIDSIIVPVHKSGSKDDTSNFRGISLINVMYKIFSNIVNKRLCNWAELNGNIDEAQAGFHAGY